MTDPAPLPIDEISGVEERPQNRREWRGVLRSLVLPVLIVATIVGGLFYLQRRDAGGGGSSGQGIVALPTEKNSTGRAPSSDIGRTPPDFLLDRVDATAPDGAQLRFSDLRGHPVLVNFWASWCTPCRQEVPEIVRAYDARGSSDLVVVGIDLQENVDQVRAFAAEFGMKFPIVIDPTGGVASAWRIGGPVKGIPSSYFIDREGIVRARNFGPMTRDTLEQNLSTIMDD